MGFTSLVKPMVNSECVLTPACGGVAEETLCAIARNQRNEFGVLTTHASGVEAIFIPCYRVESKG